MRNRIMSSAFGGSIRALVALLVLAPGLLAQTSAKPGAAAAKARKAPDLSGVWFQQEGTGVGALSKQEPPMQPWVAEKSRTLRHDRDDPNLLCLPPGIPRVLTEPRPFEIIPLPNRTLVLLEGDHLVRQIWTDGRKLPQDPDPTWMGTSVGRWDGDTLVVDTVGLTDRTWLDNAAHLHTDAMHVTERYRRLDHDTLQVDITIDDPKAYTRPWTGQRIFKLHPDWQITEDVCLDNPQTNKALTKADK